MHGCCAYDPGTPVVTELRRTCGGRLGDIAVHGEVPDKGKGKR